MHYLITGLSKSGTTALYYAVRKALPENTLYNFEPKTFYDQMQVFKQDIFRNTLSKILLGQINNSCLDLKRFDKTILIVRDPRDNLISLILFQFSNCQNFKRYKKAYDLIARKVFDPESISVIDLFDHIAALFESSGSERITRRCEKVVDFYYRHNPFFIKYEDFIDDRLTELSNYLKLTLSNDIKVGKIHKHVERSKSYGEWINWFTDNDLKILAQNNAMREFMKLFGYDMDIRLPKEKRIAVSTSLHYIEQFRPQS
jgi:hypothetical protein